MRQDGRQHPATLARCVLDLGDARPESGRSASRYLPEIIPALGERDMMLIGMPGIKSVSPGTRSSTR